MSSDRKYSKTEVSLKVTQQEHMAVEAYQSATPGLVVHRQVRWSPGKEEHKLTSKWQVTHAISGLGILMNPMCFSTREKALDFAARIAYLRHWEDPFENLGDTDDLLRKVKDEYHKFSTLSQAAAQSDAPLVEASSYTIRRNRVTRKYDVIKAENDKTVGSYSHRGTAWKEARRLDEQVT